MAKEIERKYLVTNDLYKSMAHRVDDIEQAYLCAHPDATVRLRAFNDRGYITVKSRNAGAVRHEWEYEIPRSEVDEIIANCRHEGRLIHKKRYIVEYCDKRWEVDEFLGDLKPLVLAEIELSAPDEHLELPPFVGEEVTDNPAYFNSVLAAR